LIAGLTWSTTAPTQGINKRYPAKTIEPTKRADAKRQTFNRAMKQAMDRDLIGVREIGGVDHLWLAVLD
jgi:hypothetical protein